VCLHFARRKTQSEHNGLALQRRGRRSVSCHNVAATISFPLSRTKSMTLRVLLQNELESLGDNIFLIAGSSFGFLILNILLLLLVYDADAGFGDFCFDYRFGGGDVGI